MTKIICFLLPIFIISCSRNNQITISQEFRLENNKTIVESTVENIDSVNNIRSMDKTNLPMIMYVNSKEGLRIRSEPSINGNVNGLLLYGERIVIWEKSIEIDTINNIIDFWYRLELDSRRNDWVFGGYITENLPSDLPIILGKWDNIIHQREYYYFAPNNEYSSGLKESSNGIWVSWSLNNEKILIFDLKPGMDYMAAKFGLGDEDDWSAVLENDRLPSQNINLKIIDYNTIILEFVDRSVELKRSNDLW